MTQAARWHGGSTPRSSTTRSVHRRVRKRDTRRSRGMSSTLVLKMPGNRSGNKCGIVQIGCRQPGAMPPYRRNRKEPGVSHLLDLETVVFHLEIQVGFAWHDQRLRRN